jgi:site-specific DNA-methyltransferase (adenine-specific)
MKPYYYDGTVTIYHGDAMEILPTIAERSAHLLLADPPYFRVVADDWDNQWGPDVDAFLQWTGDWLKLARRALDDRGTLAVFCWPDLACGIETEVRRRFAFLNHIVWSKPVVPGPLGQTNKAAMRRFFPTSERIILAEQLRNPDGDLFRFRDHVNHVVARETWAELRERLVALRDAAGLTNRDIDQALGTNGMAGHYFGAAQWSLPTAEAWATIAQLMAERGVDAPPYSELRSEFDARRSEYDARRREFDARPQTHALELLSDVWTFEPPAGRERYGHPTQKPAGLIAHIIQTTTRPNDLVLDPFAGTGTTLRAAKDLGRRAIGIELEERYAEIAATRCAQEVLPLFGDATP